MKPRWRQIRLLLWKDYLIRKREIITLGGIVWATIVMLSVYIVRINYEKYNIDTCQFKARALPSAGIINFMQSLVCTINNDCEPMSDYEIVPYYENSTLTKIQDKFNNILNNKSVIEVINYVPESMRMVATFVRAIDEPTLEDIAKNGLKVSNLFQDPPRVKTYLSSKIGEKQADQFMNRNITLTNLSKMNWKLCDGVSCKLSDNESKEIVIQLIQQINFRKYIKMFGTVLQSINGKDWLISLGDMVNAVFRVMHIENFIPIELRNLIMSVNESETMLASNFTYIDLNFLERFIDVFEPTFGRTNTYQTLSGIAHGLIQILKFSHKNNGNTTFILKNSVDIILDGFKNGFNGNHSRKLMEIGETFKDVFGNFNTDNESIKILDKLSQVTNAVISLLRKEQKHDVHFYLTILSKLIELTHKITYGGLNMNYLLYNATMNNKQAMNVIKQFPSSLIGNVFDALTDYERTELLSTKVYAINTFFCNAKILSDFFKVSIDQSNKLKDMFCNKEWISYSNNVIKLFEIFTVREAINDMASLVILEALGRDTSEKMYSIEKLFSIIKLFVKDLLNGMKVNDEAVNWHSLLMLNENSDFFKALNKNLARSDEILITLHGSFAHQIVRQNAILEAKITPILIECTSLFVSMNQQINNMSQSLTDTLAMMYPQIVKTLLVTMMSPEKTFKLLSTPSRDVFCNNIEVSNKYLIYPSDVDREMIIKTLCRFIDEIEMTLNVTSHLGLTISDIINSRIDTQTDDVDWRSLVTSIKNLYKNLTHHFKFIFHIQSYNNSQSLTDSISNITRDVQKYWLSVDNIPKTLQLGVKLSLLSLDIMDRPLFNLTSTVKIWSQMKTSVVQTNSLMTIIADMARLMFDIWSEQEPTLIEKLPVTVTSLVKIVPNLSTLVRNMADTIVKNNANMNAITNSLMKDTCNFAGIGKILALNQNSITALQGIQMIACNISVLIVEWNGYEHVKNIAAMFQNKPIQVSLPHPFLTLSSTLDKFVTNMTSFMSKLRDVNQSKQYNLIDAVKYAVNTFQAANTNWTLLRNVLEKVDIVLNKLHKVNTDNSSLNSVWERYIACSKSDSDISDMKCLYYRNLAYVNILKYLSTTTGEFAGDLLTYLTEISDPNVNLLQMVGFSKLTGLYTLYERFGDFIVVLLNSYWDQAFMNQVRIASKSIFWDCESLLDAMVIPVGSTLARSDLNRVKPYVCASLLYWVSMPIGENTLLNLISKTQHNFFTRPINTLTGDFSTTLDLSIKLNDTLKKIKINNPQMNISTDYINKRLSQTVDQIINFKLTPNDTSYVLFNGMNKKQISTLIYLTKLTEFLSKIEDSIDKLNGSKFTPEEYKKNRNIASVLSLLKRRPSFILEMLFDTITNSLWNNKDSDLIKTLNNFCMNKKYNGIIFNNTIMKDQFCNKNYSIVFAYLDDLNFSYLNGYMIDMIQEFGVQTQGNIDEFWRQRLDLKESIKQILSYSDNYDIHIYLKYQQNILNHYNILISFLSGMNWWSDLRSLYNGTLSNKFFNVVEHVFEISEDMLNHLDMIKIVRLIGLTSNMTSSPICDNGIMLTELLPDGTGLLTELRNSICETGGRDGALLEIIPLVFASQGYSENLTLSKDVNYINIDETILNIQSKLKLIENGPKAPLKPEFINEEKLKKLKLITRKILTPDSMAKIGFGIIGNIIDGSTLYMNTSYCSICSTLTTWMKQINLQLIKRADYELLICHMSESTFTDDEIYKCLSNNFHWELVVEELMSNRNYTILEMNKSLNQFLDLAKGFIFQEFNRNDTNINNCDNQVSKEYRGNNAIANATYYIDTFISILHIMRVASNHLNEVHGIKDSPFFVNLYDKLADRIELLVPINQAIRNWSMFESDVSSLNGSVVLNDIEVDINKLNTNDCKRYLNTNGNKTLLQICNEIDCQKLSDKISRHLNTIWIDKNIKELSYKEFWRFNWLSTIIQRIERLIINLNRLLAVGGHIHLQDFSRGKIVELLNFGLHVIKDSSLNTIVESINGILNELHPVLKNTELEFDLGLLAKGFKAIHDAKEQFINRRSFKVKLMDLLKNPELLENEMNLIGINNTNFWSIAANRIRTGYIDFKPLLRSSAITTDLKQYLCQPHLLSTVVFPSNLDVVTADDVYLAVTEQFCQMSDETVKNLLPLLGRNLNMTFIMNTVLDVVLIEIYKASNLTTSQGKAVMKNMNRIISLFPTMLKTLTDVRQVLSNEPFFESLIDASSISNLLGSPEVLKNAGKMLCGKPFSTDGQRFYKAIAETQDFGNNTNAKEIESLPTAYCRNLYKDILNMGGGKIVWSFVKPLLMGKILYTPRNKIIDMIVNKANATFERISELRALIKSFSKSFYAVDSIKDHSSSLQTIQSLIEQHALDSFGFESPGSIADMLNSFDLSTLSSMGDFIEKMSNIFECINLNRFVLASNETELAYRAAQLTTTNEFSAGVVFMGSITNNNIDNVEYKIRMDIDSVPTTLRIKNQFWTPGPESNFLDNMRYFRGFVEIQDLLNQAIVDVASKLTNPNHSIKRRDTTSDDGDVNYAVYTQQMPYPCYRKDIFQSSLYESHALYIISFFALILTVASAIRHIVKERETGSVMLMSAMGMDVASHTISWLISSLVEMLLTVLGILLVFTLGGLLPNSNPLILWLILINYGFSVILFCYMVSKFFNSANVASVCGVIVFSIFYMPYAILLSREAVMTTLYKLLSCLPMSTAFGYTLLYVGRYEAKGDGIQWSNIWDAPETGESMSVAVTNLMILFDSLLYFLIGLCIEWYKDYRNKSDNLIHDLDCKDDIGVSIVSVSKLYKGAGCKKIALDNVTINMRRGEITTLLGHNGAGKTTLVKIIMGMLRPTKGKILIRTLKCSDSIGNAKLGVCPQNDVLFENLTAAEHLELYAQLKSGLSLGDVKHEIHNMLCSIGCGGQAYERVSRLSGGMRRRVCVGIAFIARPALVLLDECSTGVDPIARRDIWSLIVKLKENRTVLLTTHHLDEAEILSDQVVIMHKGQVHTTGSPLEIKRSLGEGFKIKFKYEKTNLKLSSENTMLIQDKVHSEDPIGALTKVIKSVIGNAKMVQVTRHTVVFVLPFFGNDGTNNDFLKLTKLIEDNRDNLKYNKYTMDCTNLEHIFYNICTETDVGSGNKQNITTDVSVYEQCSTSSRETQQNQLESDDKQITPLLIDDGELKASAFKQFLSLLGKRYHHYSNNKRLLFIIFVLPMLFVIVAMLCWLFRPPLDNEIPIRLTPEMYAGSTKFYIPEPSVEESLDYAEHIKFAQSVMKQVSNRFDSIKDWTAADNPQCKCEVQRQVCNITNIDTKNLPKLLSVPGYKELLDWITTTNDIYIEKRYGGYSSMVESFGTDKKTNLIAWYNNKGHHATPSYLNDLYSAILRVKTGLKNAEISTYSHPLQISAEPISKTTILKHIADVGVSAILLIAFSIIPAAACIYLVNERQSQEKRLQLLNGVHITIYWAAAIFWDLLMIAINIVLTVIVLEIFGLDVFVERENMAAICLTLFLFGFACNAMIHLLEKLFNDASLANMMLFCSNIFIGVFFLAVLIILDLISDSDATDNIRWHLHKFFLLSPQFALGDALLAIAKNTVQSKVLRRFGMETYKSPLGYDLIGIHYIVFATVGTCLTIVNFMIEIGVFNRYFRAKKNLSESASDNEMEDLDVATERYRVELSLARRNNVQCATNAGYLNDSNMREVVDRMDLDKHSDLLQCVSLRKEFKSISGVRVAVNNVTFGLAQGQCVGLLGVNGAGKSTTFSMLTGETQPTSGYIVLNNNTVVNTSDLCDGSISYCPQIDAIDSLLTPRQILRFFCQLRAINNAEMVVERTLKLFDIVKYCNQKVGTLSGGNKRKLCTAIAFMARSSIVLLDEPTSGMDAGARVRLARIVRTHIVSSGDARRNKRCALISSHSLEDVRRLTSRLIVMHGGVIRAIAPPSVLEQRFGSDYIVCCRVTSKEFVEAVIESIYKLFPQVHTISQHHTTVRFLLSMTHEGVELRISDIFENMKKLQVEHDIEDFTLNESSFDQVFVNFSNKDNVVPTSHIGYISNGECKNDDDLTSVTSL